MNRSRAQVQLPDIGDRGHQRACSGRPVLIIAARQAGKVFLLEDLVGGRGRDGLSVSVQGPADVVDGEVLLAQGNNTVTQGLLLGSGVGAFGWGEKEGSAGILTELVSQGAETI